MAAFYVSMFYQRCRKCITGERIVDWSKLEFPIESFEKLLNACRRNKYQGFKDPVVGSFQAWAVIAPAGKFMFDGFGRMYKK